MLKFDLGIKFIEIWTWVLILQENVKYRVNMHINLQSKKRDLISNKTCE